METMKKVLNRMNGWLDSGIFWGLIISAMVLLYIISEEVYNWVAIVSSIIGLVYYFKVILPDLLKMEEKEEN